MTKLKRGGSGWTAALRLHPRQWPARNALYRRHLEPARRVYQHREGLIKGFTSRYGIYRLVHYEMADTMEAAITREKQLKKWNRDWKLRLIEESNLDWNDLAIGLGFPPLRQPLGSGDDERS